MLTISEALGSYLSDLKHMSKAGQIKKQDIFDSDEDMNTYIKDLEDLLDKIKEQKKQDMLKSKVRWLSYGEFDDD